MKSVTSFVFLLCGVINLATADGGNAPSIESKNWKEVHQTKKVEITNLIGDVRVRTTKIKDEFEIVTAEQHNEKVGRLVVETDKKGDVLFIKVARLNQQKEALDLDQNDQARIDLTVFVPVGNDIHVTTKDGLIEAKGLADPLVARSDNGNIKMLKNKNALDVFSYGGYVEANLYPNATEKDQKFETATGNVFVIVGSEQEHDFVMSSSGRFTTDFSLKIKKDFTKEPNKTAKGKINGGGSKLTLKSLRGNISLLSYQELKQ